MEPEKRQRNTPQRRIILEEIQKVTSHPTAVEVYEMVRRRLPRISLGTVYRNLERLAADGRLHKLGPGGGEARFDGDLAPHYHVRCVHCGRLADVRGVAADAVGDEVEEAAGYEILGHRLEFVGICPECKTCSETEAGGVCGDRRE